MTWHRRPRGRAARAMLAAALLITLAGCTSWAPTTTQGPSAVPSPSAVPEAPAPARVTLPHDQVTIVDTDDPRTAALAVSAALFASAPAAFVVSEGDERAMGAAGLGAATLGLPLLVGPPAPSPSSAPSASSVPPTTVRPSATGAPSSAPAPQDPSPTAPWIVALSAELDRLQVQQVITVGEGHAFNWDQLAAPGREVLRLDTDPQKMDEFLRERPGHPGSRLEALTVVAEDTPMMDAALATARAAGAQVHVSAADDPLMTAEVMTAVRDEKATHLVAVGDVFGAEATGGSALSWKFQVAQSGQQLPGGGGQWFPEHILIGLYGTPESDALGLLGHQGLPETIKLAESMAAPYRALTQTTVVPAFEIIATVAAAQAGGDGNYSNELDVDTIFEWAQAADKAGFAVMIDLQPGRSTFLSQAKQYQKVLMLPNVGLALDPEWRIKPDQVHLEQIGQVSAAEVNEVAGWLADLTRDNALPQKLFVLHQFQLKMLQDRSQIDLGRPELAPLIHADGQGSQPAKQDTWRALHEDAPPEAFWGWKNFTKEDHPMLTPEQTMQVIPVPNLVTYQ